VPIDSLVGMVPCAANPALWHGNVRGLGGRKRAHQACLLCVSDCHMQQECARQAVAEDEKFGVWAGVYLPGDKKENRSQLEWGQDLLRRIAAGEAEPDEGLTLFELDRVPLA
jgi:hypothetical protein